ncbi:MAG: polysaccharide biosynthesis C-terminal domain-containing protein, partial [Lachnospiraceae bacterium]|nr:polysaccharide biosynthesis C-terminal domain-containing protein [Lachnospiraceae bacterium]
KDQRKVNVTATNGVFIFALSYIFVAILGLTVVRPFYAFQINPGQEQIMELGVTYLTIVMVGSFGIFGQFIFERLLQSTGRTFLTMISQMSGAVINIILDPILIFGYFGFPKLGIAGAAIATIIGQIAAGIIAYIFNITRNPEIHLEFKGFKPNGRIIAEIYEIGIPSIIMQSIGSVMTAGMNRILMGINSTGTAVFGVYFKLQSFFFMPVFGLNNGIIPIIAYNYGAQKRKRMLNTLKYGYIIAFILTAVGFIGFMTIPDKLLLLFDASPQMLEIGVPALRTIAFHYLIAWYCIITGSLFQALGKAMFSLYVSVARQLLVLLPAAYILAKIGGLSLIWWSFPIAEIMSCIISTTCLVLVYKKIISKIPA